MEQKTQMEITFNLFILSMNAAQLHALKILSLSVITQNFHGIFKTSLSHSKEKNAFDLHMLM